MEQLYHIIKIETDEEVRTQYVQEQFNNSEFGNILFQVLENVSSQSIPDDGLDFLSTCCGLLNRWAKINWHNLTIDQKIQYFDNLKKLILAIKEAHVIQISDSFVDIAKREIKTEENYQIFEVHYEDFFNALSNPQNCSINQLKALLNIIDFASKNYKKNIHSKDQEELSLFSMKVIESIVPYLGIEDFLQSEEGCQILGYVLDIFRRPFLKIKPLPPIEEASALLSFSENIESGFIKHEFLNTQLVCSAVRFLNSFYKSGYIESFASNIQQILQIHFELLSTALEFKSEDDEPDYNLISQILEVIEHFYKEISPDQTIIDILLESSKLTPSDTDNFINNPNMFYYDVYKTSCVVIKHNSSRLARSILANLCNKDKEFAISLISYMITLPCSENIIRCLGLCIKSNDEINLPESIVQYSADLIHNPIYQENPILVASILDFLRFLVPRLLIDQNMEIMDELPRYFTDYEDYPVILTMSTRLLKHLIKADVYPFDEAMQTIIPLLETSFTSHALKCVKLMCKINTETVIPYADLILGGIFESFTHSHLMMNFEEEEEENEEDDFEKQEEETAIIESNLDFCSKLIDSTGPYLVKPYFVEIVYKIFKNDEDHELIDSLETLLTAIFGSGTSLLPDFIELIITACQDEEWEGHSSELIKPLFKLISTQPELFIQLNECSILGEFCMKILTNQEIKEKGNYFNFATLLSWIIILDSQNNKEIGDEGIQTIFQCCETVCLDDNTPHELILCFLEILASIGVAYQIFPNPEIIERMEVAINSNWILRICQKQLYTAFFLSLANAQNDAADRAVFNAFILMSKMDEQREFEDDEEYFDSLSFPIELSYLTFPFPFNSPFDEFPITEMTVSGLNLCSSETIENIRQNFQNIFNQFASHLEQQTE